MTRAEWLASDENPDAEQRAAYRAILAGETPPRRPDPSDAIRLSRLAARCPYRSTSTACGCYSCALAGGARKSPQECWACVDRYGL